MLKRNTSKRHQNYLNNHRKKNLIFSTEANLLSALKHLREALIHVTTTSILYLNLPLWWHRKSSSSSDTTNGSGVGG